MISEEAVPHRPRSDLDAGTSSQLDRIVDVAGAVLGDAAPSAHAGMALPWTVACAPDSDGVLIVSRVRAIHAVANERSGRLREPRRLGR